MSRKFVVGRKNPIFLDLKRSTLEIIIAHTRLYEKIGKSSSPSLNSHNLKDCISAQLALPKAFPEFLHNLSSSKKSLKRLSNEHLFLMQVLF